MYDTSTPHPSTTSASIASTSIHCTLHCSLDTCLPHSLMASITFTHPAHVVASVVLGLDAHPRDVYGTCHDYNELCALLQTNPVPAVTRLAARIRNWKLNHKLATLQDAFVEHRNYTLEPDKYRTQNRKRSRTPSSPPSTATVAVLPTVAPQTEGGNSAVADVVEASTVEVPLKRLHALEQRVQQLEQLVAQLQRQRQQEQDAPRASTEAEDADK